MTDTHTGVDRDDYWDNVTEWQAVLDRYGVMWPSVGDNQVHNMARKIAELEQRLASFPYELVTPLWNTCRPGQRADGIRALRDWVQHALKTDAANSEALYEECIAICDRVLLREALAATNGNASAAAKLLGIHRQTLRQKLRNLIGCAEEPVDGADD